MGNFSSLPFTEAVIREVMRIETITPLSVGHRCTETTQFFEYTIPEDTLMLTNLAAMHNDPDLWGDPENFRPDRFIKDGKIVKDLTLPFGLGANIINLILSSADYSNVFFCRKTSMCRRNFRPVYNF